MLVSEDYPWSKLLYEYVIYILVGCINVAIFFGIYWLLYEADLHATYRAGSAWALAYFISTWQSHFLHRWLTFESGSDYRRSLVVMVLIYSVFLAISTASQAYFADTQGYNHWLIWGANTVAFGFLSFLSLRIFAFPLSDGRVSRQERLEVYRESRRS